MITNNQTLKVFENIKDIKEMLTNPHLMRIKLTLEDLYGYNIIAYKTSLFYANLIDAWIVPTWTTNKKER